MTNTGTDNYGGAIVTDERTAVHRRDDVRQQVPRLRQATGKLLWETTLPAAGNATPSLYMVNGRAYIVIACGGGKNDAPSGGTYVAFALPVGSS